MSDSVKREPLTLKRWSQRKLAASRAAQAPEPPPPAVAPAVAPTVATQPPPPAEPANALPPVESLTPDSDFTPFLRPGVDEAVKRGALKRLFSDPRFNVMDGLDIYIDDYSKPDPLPAAVAATLAQARYVFDPPKTRVNADGHVEDVPPEAVDAAGNASQPDTQAAASQEAPQPLASDAGRDPPPQ